MGIPFPTWNNPEKWESQSCTKPNGYSIFHLDVLTALAMVLSTPEAAAAVDSAILSRSPSSLLLRPL